VTERPPSDILGLGGTLPGPGWAVLDAARDQRFTGELIAESDATFRVYFDRGTIYVAERATDPPLGTRLVEAGALNPAQLEYGSLRIGDIDHLGRLFDRVPSVNRDGVVVLNELMTEECVRSLAGQTVRAVTVTSYRHHPSGMHRWNLAEPSPTPGTSTTVPTMALPAPHPDAIPVTSEPPGAPIASDASSRRDHAGQPRVDDAEPDDRPSHDRFDPTELFFDDVVAWNEPLAFALADPASTAGARASQSDLLIDAPPDRWIDQLGHAGVAHANAASAQPRLPALPVRPLESFEMVWPSGETVDVVDDDRADTSADVDHDRVGPTARVPFPNGSARPGGATADRDPDAADKTDDRTPDDEVSPLAVRRAVATIDTGSLEARRRLVDVSSEATTPPGRLAVQRDSSVWRSANAAPTTSVFDELPVDANEPTDQADTPAADHHGRSNALRRLIDSLRRP
jgi:hypothetical protein